MAKIFENIPQAFLELTSLFPFKCLYRQVLPDGSGFVSRNIQEVETRVTKIAGSLKKAGVDLKTPVAILSNTRPEWLEADLATLFCGGVVVSIYQSLTPQDIGYILYDSGASIVFAENEEQLTKLRFILEQEIKIPATEERKEEMVQISLKKIITFEKTSSHPLVVSLDELLSSSDEPLTVAPSAVTRGSLASLVYTSGTTGPAKGVMQTHGNHLANVRQAREAEIYKEDTTIFLFLPLAHSFAKLMGYIGFTRGVELLFPSIGDTRSSKPDPERSLRDLGIASGSIVPIVPRVLEKMKEGIEKVSRESSLKGKMVSLTIKNGRRARINGCPLSKICYPIFAPLRNKIKKQLFGQHFQYAVSGGAKLPVPVAQFFHALDIEVLEGYGLTETCVATNVNRLGKKKIGTVGPVLASDIEIRIAPDGEILFRGPNVGKGYFKRPTATEKAWDADGWFYTGDLGSIDSEGFLSITGRKKELIVTSGGKKIAPESIENLLKAIPLISQVMLYGDGRQYCVAIITLNRQLIKSASYTDIQVREVLEKEIDGINQTLSSFETVKKYFIALEEFTVENGLLTPTFKVKRGEVAKRYEKEIAGLYP